MERQRGLRGCYKKVYAVRLVGDEAVRDLLCMSGVKPLALAMGSVKYEYITLCGRCADNYRAARYRYAHNAIQCATIAFTIH